MKKLSKIIAVLVIMAVMVVPTIVSAAQDDWPMFHHDLALSGVSTSTAPNTNNTLWIYDTGSPVHSSPAIVEGMLYIGGTDGKLYAVDADTGSPIWIYQTGGPIFSSPAVAYGKVYFLSTDGNVYALDANTGALVWSVAIGPGPWDWSSPSVHDNRVFIAGSTGWVYSLNAGMGTVIWSTNIGGSPNGPIAVVNGKVYSGTHNFDATNPTLVALDELTGAIIWTYNHTAWHPPTVGMINSNGVAVVDGDGDGKLEVYFGIVTWYGTGNEAVCLDEATGNERWTYTLNGWSTSTPAVHNGRVFIGSDDWNIYALNAGTGSFICSYTTNGPVWAAPAVADGKVFFGSLDHFFYAIDESDCSLVWSYDTGTSRLMGSPAVADGKVFVGNENGKIYAFGPIKVNIDIKPGSFPNSINLGSKGNVPVAILSDPTFDATTVDRSTVVFAGASPLPIGKSPEDVNGDGLLDVVLHFSTQSLNLQLSDTEACLTGKTLGGQDFKGCDSVRIVK